MQNHPPLISRTVWILALVSLFADFASEMLYPVVPVYLKEIGFSVALIGILEGVAEFVVGLSKGYFGKLSDDTGRRLPFIRWGYALSALSKPMMGWFTWPAWIFFSRATDRMGKGLRSAARDALLASESSSANRARIFSFHRSWDTVGAILGPLFALAFLHFFPGAYRQLFFWALLPGMVSVALLFLLREKPVSNRPDAVTRTSTSPFSYLSYWKESGDHYRHLLKGLLLFTLANSSDAFLLLQAKAITGSDTLTISAYIFYNIVYALSAFPMGIIADKWGMKKTLLAGLLVFTLVYLGFAFATGTAAVFALFFLYGIYAAATEGISKAWIANLAPPGKRGTAIGFYTSWQSIFTLVSSSAAGLLWMAGGHSLMFISSALLTLLAIGWLATGKSGL